MFQTWRSLSASGWKKETLFCCCGLLGFCFHERGLPLVGRLRHTAYLFLPVRYTHTRNTRLSLGCFLHLIDGSLAATFFCALFFNSLVLTFLIIPMTREKHVKTEEFYFPNVVRYNIGIMALRYENLFSICSYTEGT